MEDDIGRSAIRSKRAKGQHQRRRRLVSPSSSSSSSSSSLSSSKRKGAATAASQPQPQPHSTKGRRKSRRRRIVSSRSPSPNRIAIAPSSSPELVYIRTSPGTTTMPSHQQVMKQKQDDVSSSPLSKSTSGSSTERSVEGHIYTSNIVDMCKHNACLYDDPIMTDISEREVAELQAVPYSERISISTIEGKQLQIEGQRKQEDGQGCHSPLYLDMSILKDSIKIEWLVAHGRERFVRRVLCMILKALLEHGRCEQDTPVALDATYMPDFMSKEARINRTQSGLLDMYFRLGFKVDTQLNDEFDIADFRRAWAARRRKLKTADPKNTLCAPNKNYVDAPAIALSTTVGEVLQRCAFTPNLRVPEDDVLYMIMHDPIQDAVQRINKR